MSFLSLRIVIYQMLKGGAVSILILGKGEGDGDIWYQFRRRSSQPALFDSNPWMAGTHASKRRWTTSNAGVDCHDPKRQEIGHRQAGTEVEGMV